MYIHVYMNNISMYIISIYVTCNVCKDIFMCTYLISAYVTCKFCTYKFMCIYLISIYITCIRHSVYVCTCTDICMCTCTKARVHTNVYVRAQTLHVACTDFSRHYIPWHRSSGEGLKLEVGP